jgi:hypothetical protein
MAEATNREGGSNGWMLPSKHLLQRGVQDLPEPQPLRKYIGASVILLATALGSGELILWPFITAQVGIGLLWLAFIGFTMQFFLNMEIERYTLVTGETAVTGFSRLWYPWGILFVIAAIVTNFWPGWVTSGATLFEFIFNLQGVVVPVAIIQLVAIGLTLTLSPVVFQAVEKIQFVLVGIIVLFLIVAIIIATEASSWGSIFAKAPGGVANFPQYMADLGGALILGAIAFAGAGGANNLVQSNYARDKGLGMGGRIPNIVSPVTGEEEAVPSLGYTFETDEENMRRWSGWWKVANQEQLIVFYAIGLAVLIGMSVLVNSTVGIMEGAPEGELAFINEEGEALKNIVAPWFGTFFYVAGFIILFSTNLGVMDWVSRLSADSLKVTFLRDSEFWSESKIYAAIVWLIAIVGSVILLSGVDQPIVLLVISAAGGGVIMAFYSVLLIVLNRRVLPEPIRLRGWRLPIMYIIAIFFIAFSVYLVLDQAGLVGG